jgi:hypothetical protein
MKLLVAGFIQEILHPDWLANPILVQKKNSAEWRMCINYTDLNKHCPKDPFGLPRIDQIMDSTADQLFYPSLIVIQVIIRLLSVKKAKARLLSSLRLAPTATRPCHLGLKMLGLHTSGLSKLA